VTIPALEVNAPMHTAPSQTTRGISVQASSVAQADARKTAVEFEAVFLGTFVEAMLPKSDSMYGGGMAGDMWRSQLASGIAMQLAETNLLGIGEQVVRDAQAGEGTAR